LIDMDCRRAVRFAARIPAGAWQPSAYRPWTLRLFSKADYSARLPLEPDALELLHPWHLLVHELAGGPVPLRRGAFAHRLVA
jgi:hypothetical protein